MISIDTPLELLGGLSPAEFMRDYWQKRPLLIRQAIPGFRPTLTFRDIRELVRREEVESRLIWREEAEWHMKTGPFTRLPAMNRPDWTLLAQAVDLHDDASADLMHHFRFLPDARLDDLMISIAGDGGGVGPHFDSYDVFLLQGRGRRRWRISQQHDLSLVPGLPLKILQNFQTEDEYVLEPGDMLYLPPHVAHDGVALGECMTLSIGFRAPTQAALASGLLQAANDQILANLGDTTGLYAEPVIPGPVLSATYRDPQAQATTTPAEIPEGMVTTALEAIAQVSFTPALASRFLGQWLTEPSSNAMFEPLDEPADLQALAEDVTTLRLDRCSRMLYRDEALYINGETAPVPASATLRALADARTLTLHANTWRALTDEEKAALAAWLEEGWLVAEPGR